MSTGRNPVGKAAILGQTTNRLRECLLVLYLVGTASMTVDLVLLGHFQNLRQWAPLFALQLGPLTLIWQQIWCTHRATRVFQFVMVLLAATGFAGLWFHSSRNLGFALEIDPSAAARQIVNETLTGPTPTLAPGALIHLGLLGLLYTYRHPWLRSTANGDRARSIPSREAQKSRYVQRSAVAVAPLFRRSAPQSRSCSRVPHDPEWRNPATSEGWNS